MADAQSWHMPNMQVLALAQAQELAEYIMYERNEVMFWWGGPGMGKTQGADQLAQRRNAYNCDIRLGQYDSVDVRGIPAPDDLTKTTVWYMPSTLPFKGNAFFEELLNRGAYKYIQLTLDELTMANSATQGVAYQLINQRRVGEHVLMDNVRIIAMSNREGDRSVSNRMPLPLANRFGHVEIITYVKGWVMWAQAHNIHPMAIAFMLFTEHQNILNQFDPSSPNKIFATERTWEMAIRCFMDFVDGRCNEHIARMAMAAFIGQGLSAMFWGFYDTWTKIPSIDTILKNPKTAKVPDELSMRYAVAVAVSGAITVNNIDAAYTYIKRLEAEYVMIAMHLAMKRDKQVYTSDTFVKFSTEYKGSF